MYLLLPLLSHMVLLNLLGFSLFHSLSFSLSFLFSYFYFFLRGMLIGSGVMAITIIIACVVFGSSEIKVQRYDISPFFR